MSEEILSEFTLCPLAVQASLKIHRWKLAVTLENGDGTESGLLRPWSISTPEQFKFLERRRLAVELSADISKVKSNLKTGLGGGSIEECPVMLVCEDSNATMYWQTYPVQLDRAVVPRPKDSPWRKNKLKVNQGRLLVSDQEQGTLLCKFYQPLVAAPPENMTGVVTGNLRLGYLPFRASQWQGVGPGELQVNAPSDIEVSAAINSVPRQMQMSPAQRWPSPEWLKGRRSHQLIWKGIECPLASAARDGEQRSAEYPQLTVDFWASSNAVQELMFLGGLPLFFTILAVFILSWKWRLPKKLFSRSSLVTLAILWLILGAWIQQFDCPTLWMRQEPLRWVANYRLILFAILPLVSLISVRPLLYASAPESLQPQFDDLQRQESPIPSTDR